MGKLEKYIQPNTIIHQIQVSQDFDISDQSYNLPFKKYSLTQMIQILPKLREIYL